MRLRNSTPNTCCKQVGNSLSIEELTQNTQTRTMTQNNNNNNKNQSSFTKRHSLSPYLHSLSSDEPSESVLVDAEIIEEHRGGQIAINGIEAQMRRQRGRINHHLSAVVRWNGGREVEKEGSGERAAISNEATNDDQIDCVRQKSSHVPAKQPTAWRVADNRRCQSAQTNRRQSCRTWSRRWLRSKWRGPREDRSAPPKGSAQR